VRCLVTGATGHIGSHLVRYLVERGVEVAALVRPTTSNLWRIEDIFHRLHIIKGDLCNIDHSSAAIQEFAPEIVIHLGWHGVGSGYRNDPAQITQNLSGSLKLLELAHECGCKRWIGLGSQAEYGPYDRVLTEDLPTHPVTTYGVAKLCLGLLSGKLCEAYGIGFAWLRLTAAYGPMDDEEHMIPQVILKLLRGEKPSLTLGEQRWDYLYVCDVAEAIWRTAVTPEAQGIFNLGSGEAYSIRSIAERIRDLIAPNLPLGFGEVPYRPDQIMHLQADVSRLKRASGWAPQVRLDEGLRQTVEWVKGSSAEVKA
jgi:UDP-glucose 4-epimerase